MPIITWTPDIFSLADTAWKHHKYPCFCILPLEFGVNIDMHKHEKGEVLCYNPNKSSKEMPGNPSLQIHGRHYHRYHLAKYASPIQTILYQFKWDMARWKWPKCSQDMQWTWWQTVSTQHMGLRVFGTNVADKQRVLMHRHQRWNVRHGLCHIYMRYIYIWVVYSFCLFCCLFIIVTWWYIWCIVWQVASKRKYRHVW